MTRTVSVLFAGLLGFVGLEGALFHTSLYSSILDPDSSAGYLETVLDNELRRPKDGPNQILAIGDSRMALTPRIANQENVGYTFGSVGVAGTTPRCWYYMLRDVDPTARRYAAILITIESYDDAETWENFNVRESDLHYLVARLRLSDLFEFSRSYQDPLLEWQAFRGILLRGFIYKRDLEDFLLDPGTRIENVNRSRRDSHNWFYDFVATSKTLDGLSVDWDAKTLAVAPGTNAALKQKLEGRLVKPQSPQTGRLTAYLNYWLGKTYDRYRNSPTRLVFVRLPRAPWIRPDGAPYNPHSSVRQLAANPNVTLLPEHLLDSLEKPEFFQDELHLNEAGLEQFSVTVAHQMRDALWPAAVAMLFNTIQFWVFFAVVAILFYASPRPLRKWILLAASYFFYMSWNWRFAPLLLTLTAIDYACAIWIERCTLSARRKLFLVIGLSANLGFLGFFKYYNFLASMLADALRRDPHSFALAIILPLGISFHTFQSMSYLIDVYRGEQEVIHNPIDYAVFIAFFPQLVAGPIVRAREFFKDYYHWKPPIAEEQLRGVLWILLGLAKKMALADHFAQIADSYFQHLATHPGAVAAWSGTISFAMQIFFDFSGYTDMAIGMALLLGFHFPMNFRRPYLAFSITDFWHRWHMSLSRWLRDYLYIPLGGNRHGSLMTYRNLMLTMLLGGLWHGASWNFVIWGGYHGALLSLERVLGREHFQKKPGWLLYPFRAVSTFALVCIGWVFFRAATLRDSLYVIRQMFHGLGESVIPVWLLCFVAISLLIAIFEEQFDWIDKLARGPVWAYATAVAILLLSVELIGVTEKAIPFVYFQF